MGGVLRRAARLRGFTAVELITLLALLVILAALAIPGMSPVVSRHRLRGAAWQVAGDLRLARQRAVTLRAPFRVCVASCAIAVPAGTYSIERSSGSVFASESGAAVRLPVDVQLSATATPVFYENGAVVPGSTFRVSNVAGAYEIRVAGNGRVRVCSGTCP